MKPSLPVAQKTLMHMLSKMKGQPLSQHNYADEVDRMAQMSVCDTLEFYGVPKQVAEELSNKYKGNPISRLGKCWRRI